MTRVKPRVLLIDDDAPLRRAVGRRLRPHFEIVEAGGVVHAEAVVRDDAGAFDAVVVDLQMKDGDGFDALDRIRAVRPDLARRAVLYTGAEITPALLARVRATGCALVHKASEFETLIAAALRASRSILDDG